MFHILHNLMTITTAYMFFNKKFCIPYYTCITLLWIVYKNECIISFFDKVKINKNYSIGENGYSTPDLVWSKLNSFRFDRILSILAIPLYYYLITKNVIKSVSLALILILLLIENKIFYKITTSRFRYVLLLIIFSIMTDKNLNIKSIKILYNILLPFSIMLITFFRYNNQKDINEMTIIGISSILIIFLKNNPKLLEKLI